MLYIVLCKLTGHYQIEEEIVTESTVFNVEMIASKTDLGKEISIEVSDSSIINSVSVV
jgi:hypothetical protein